MAKLTLSDITSGYASTTALNDNFALIETALENTLSRDGTSPNSMNADLDMNGYAILNQRATSGNENFVWLGPWATGTSYQVNNLVYATEGTNIGNGLICIEAHTAGSTLDGDYAKWEVYVLRGAVVGGGIVGPVTSAIGYIPQWNDVGGTELKAGVPIGSSGGVQAYSANLATFATKTFIDDDTMATASSTAIPSSESIKAYADTKVSSVTGTAPVVSSGGVTPTISMAAATASVNGYMTSTYAAKLDGIAAGANVGITADIMAGGVGMMATLVNSVGTTVASNATVSGAYLSVSGSGVKFPGTWRNIGTGSVGPGDSGVFQRIS